MSAPIEYHIYETLRLANKVKNDHVAVLMKLRTLIFLLKVQPNGDMLIEAKDFQEVKEGLEIVMKNYDVVIKEMENI